MNKVHSASTRLNVCPSSRQHENVLGTFGPLTTGPPKFTNSFPFQIWSLPKQGKLKTLCQKYSIKVGTTVSSKPIQILCSPAPQQRWWTQDQPWWKHLSQIFAWSVNFEIPGMRLKDRGHLVELSFCHCYRPLKGLIFLSHLPRRECHFMTCGMCHYMFLGSFPSSPFLKAFNVHFQIPNYIIKITRFAGIAVNVDELSLNF